MSTDQTLQQINYAPSTTQLGRSVPAMPVNRYGSNMPSTSDSALNLAANQVTQQAIWGASAEDAPLTGQINPFDKAVSDFHGLFFASKAGGVFDASDRTRLNESLRLHRAGLNPTEGAAFDRVADIFNQSWEGEKFAKEDWARFNNQVAALRSDPVAMGASGSVDKAVAGFNTLFYQCKNGVVFNADDRRRLNERTQQYRAGLNSSDQATFDKVVTAFNQSWKGKLFGNDDWGRFYTNVATMRNEPATVPVKTATA